MSSNKELVELAQAVFNYNEKDMATIISNPKYMSLRGIAHRA